MKSDKFVKLSAIEEMAKPMKALHEEMGDEEYECPKCGYKMSEDESEKTEDEES